MFLTTLVNNTMLVNLFVALVLGMVIGIERYVAHKTAGMRTYALISMGSAIFVVVAQFLARQFGNNVYQYYIVAQIITAVGFLGMGAVFHRSDNNQTSGLTTASGLWVAAGVGMACGLGWYQLAIVITVFVLFTFVALWFIEEQIDKLPITRKNLPTKQQTRPAKPKTPITPPPQQ